MATKQWKVRDNVTGQVHTIEGDENASPDELEGAAQAMFGGTQRVQDGSPQVGTMGPVKKGGTGGGLSDGALGLGGPRPQPDYNPAAGMSPFQQGAAGLGKAMSNAWTGLVGAIPGVDNTADVKEMRARDAPLMDTGAGFTGNLAGQAGMMLAPGGVLKGAGLAADALGATRAAGTLDAVGGALIAPRGIVSGGTVGGITGAIQPAASAGERFLNTGLGVTAGAAIPAVSRAYNVGMSALEPFYQGGQQKIVSRVINNAAGSDAANVVNRLEEATRPISGPFQGAPRQTVGELVPGSIPTTSQVAGNPGISALEQAASAVNPEVKNTLSAQLKSNNAARVGELHDIAGSDGRREMFANERDATAQGLYDNAFKTPIDPAAVTAQQPVFDKLSANPYIQDAIPTAKKLAAGDGVTLDAGSVQGMHYLKLALDDAISSAASPTTSAGKNTLRQMSEAQRQLVGAIEGVSPDYAAARQTYVKMSQPVNQMDVGQALIDKSVSNLDGNIKPTQFANALADDRTAARATGYPGATMEGTVDNQTQNRLQMILDDVRRQTEATRAGTGIGSNTVQNLAYGNMIGQSGMPSWLARFAPLQVAGNIAGRGMDLAYSKANNQLSALLARVMSDPAEVARVMRSTGPYANNGLAEILRLGVQPTMTAIPSVVNANK